MTDLSRIRNFSIVAHIDHGKSTLADRLIQLTGTVAERDMKEQLLDAMDIERERGITIKANTVRIDYPARDGHTYVLNLIDTPGHVDFAYEVSRSMQAVEGSLLVVDASQGVEAQTLANVYQAIDADHEIVPVLNKIDLPAAEPERVKEQIEDVIGIDASEAVEISAKTGLGIPDVLEAIVTRLPAPKGTRDAPLKAMLVDSYYDPYLGVVVLIRVIDGVIRKGDRIRMMKTGGTYQIDRLGVFKPAMQDIAELGPGEIGFFHRADQAGPRHPRGRHRHPREETVRHRAAGLQAVDPRGFSAASSPVDANDFEDLRDAMEKLALNDASFTFEMETSAALGFGFRCGFLGLLHLEVIRDRLEREYDIDLITTAPSVIYHIHLRDGSMIALHNPADMPDAATIDHIEEPRIKATILVPDEYLGDVLALCHDRRGEQLDLTYAGSRAMVVYDLPLNEVVFDFYDRLKSVTKGYASFDYQMIGYRQDHLVKMQILVNDEPVDALSIMVHPRPGRDARPRHVREAEGADPAPHVQDPDPGGDRRAGHRARDHRGAAQGRDGQVLWRGRHAETETARQAESGQEEDAPVREGGNPAIGVHQRVEDGLVGRDWSRRFQQQAELAGLRPVILRFDVRRTMPGQREIMGPAGPCCVNRLMAELPLSPDGRYWTGS